MTAQARRDYEKLDDLELAGLIAVRDPAAVRLVTTRNNQRLFRTAWSILKHRSEAEDAVQSAYLKAFAGMDRFEGRSSLSTWLTRIVINEALGRARATRRRQASLDSQSIAVMDTYREKLMPGSVNPLLPDGSLALGQVRQLLEQAIARLPDPFRLVFILREIEGLDVEEVAESLDILAATVKTRHFRAKRLLQQDLAPELKSALTGTFPFAGADCEAMTQRVLDALA